MKRRRGRELQQCVCAGTSSCSSACPGRVACSSAAHRYSRDRIPEHLFTIGLRAIKVTSDDGTVAGTLCEKQQASGSSGGLRAEGTRSGHNVGDVDRPCRHSGRSVVGGVPARILQECAEHFRAGLRKGETTARRSTPESQQRALRSWTEAEQSRFRHGRLTCRSGCPATIWRNRSRPSRRCSMISSVNRLFLTPARQLFRAWEPPHRVQLPTIRDREGGGRRSGGRRTFR